MKLLNAFKTPAWEQRDPERRAQAVRDGSEPELLARLSEIAAQDPEPAVRRAALARLAVPAQLLARLRAETDAATREAAAQRLAKLLLDPAAGLAPGARLAAVGLDLPTDLLERVAEGAPEAEARRAALARVVRPAYLARRCAEEPDAGLRAELLERIEGEDALDKLAEALRKRDKTLARRARERAEASRLARGDSAALGRYADALCESLTAWARALPEDVESRLEVARQTWVVQREALDATAQARVEAYFLRVREALERRAQRASEAAAPALPPPPPDAGPEAVAPIVMQGEAAYPAQLVPAAPAPVAVDWSALDKALSDANRAAAAKHLGEARPALAQVQQLLPTLPKLDRARRERLAEIEARVEELDQWQRWSGNRVRARLCDEMEALIAAAPHPDAVANKVKELQLEWARVEAAEPGDADRTSGLARRFRALCGRAMAPTRPYFEQRHALREQRRGALETQLAEAAPEALAALAAPAAIGLRRRLVEALRTLDELEPKARTALARKLREALTRIDAHLDAQREDAALARRKLIARLRRELTHAAPADALALARDAQQQWKVLPRVAREQEAALEQELHALIDPLFAREREQRSQVSEQAGRVESESRRVLAELAALAQGDAEALAHAEGKLAALAASWKELHATTEAAPDERRARREPGREARGGRAPQGDRAGRDDRAGSARRSTREGDGRRDGGRDPAQRERERAFDQAVAGVRQAQARLEGARRGARLQALLDAAQLLEARAAGTLEPAAAQAQWEQLPLEAGDRTRLAPRWQAADAAAAPAAAETWLVEAELDAGLDSPPAAQALRRERQMRRLAQRLQGANATPPPAHERLHGWIALGPLAPDTARAARLARLLEAWSAPPR
jgi:exonuclease SbcC